MNKTLISVLLGGLFVSGCGKQEETPATSQKKCNRSKRIKNLRWSCCAWPPRNRSRNWWKQNVQTSADSPTCVYYKCNESCHGIVTNTTMWCQRCRRAMLLLRQECQRMQLHPSGRHFEMRRFKTGIGLLSNRLAKARGDAVVEPAPASNGTEAVSSLAGLASNLFHWILSLKGLSKPLQRAWNVR